VNENDEAMKTRSQLILYFSLGALLVCGSCGKDALNNLSAEESRIYITNRDSTADFSSYRTFSIVDSVAVIQNNQRQFQRTSADAALLQLITEQMQDRGYTKVSRSDDPDLGINVTRVSNAYLNIVQYPYDWWNSPAYWDPVYWGYPGYSYYFPPMFGYYQTREDILTIDMIDLKDAQKDQQLTGVWNATLKGQGVLNSDNYPSEIKAVFDQSPYLKGS
jgi:hypothetical protein